MARRPATQAVARLATTCLLIAPVAAGCTRAQTAGGSADTAATPPAQAADTPPAGPVGPAGRVAAAEPYNILTPEERAAGWRLLFDGRTTDGWRGFRQDTMPSGWTVVDGALSRTGPGGDIVTRDQFGDFELMVDWKVAPGGNSGIFYRVTEEGGAVYETGPEMQVLDDERHADGKSALTSAGSVFGLYPAPRGAVRPAGEWNRARVVVRGSHVEHWLNGTKTAEYELGSDEWKARMAATKFKAWPGYGKAARGHIALQDHGDPVSFRNVKIRELR